MSNVVTQEMLREAARDQIAGRRRSLLVERELLKAKQAELATRERMLDRELAECTAAAKFFGIEFNEPVSEAQIMRVRDQVRLYESRMNDAEIGGREIWQSRASEAAHELRSLLRRRHMEQSQLALVAPQEAAEEAVHPPAVEKTMPKIKDIALEQLRAAHPAGRKAAEIRKYVETTYSTKIHEKTVGMTLYRLANDGFVHRLGQTWFYGTQAGLKLSAESENPGVPTPGPTHVAETERRNA